MKRLISLSVISFLGLASLAFAKGDELSLEEFLDQAVKQRPEIEAAHWREAVAAAQLDTTRAAILPTLEAGPVITRGEPGGSSVFGWNGNISAAMRSGQGFAGSVKYTAWDFGRTSANLRAGTADVQFTQAESERIQGDLLISLAQDYLNCARNRSLVELLNPLKMQTAEIRDTIERLVKTGQRTPVDGHLARAQALEVDTQIQIAQERILFEQRQLGISLGRTAVTCLNLESLSTTVPEFPGSQGAHPWIVSARTRSTAAQERLRGAHSERAPRLQLLGNGGYFDSDKLPNPWNYSVSVALAIPLWDAKIGSEIRRAEATQKQVDAELKTTELRLKAFQIAAEERFRVSETQVQSLERENNEALLGFAVAKQRYQKSVGMLIELRETVRNLIRVSSAFAAAKAELVNARFLLSWYRGKPN